MINTFHNVADLQSMYTLKQSFDRQTFEHLSPSMARPYFLSAQLMLLTNTNTENALHFNLFRFRANFGKLSSIAIITTPRHHHPPSAYTKLASRHNPAEDVCAVFSAFASSIVTGGPVAIVAAMMMTMVWYSY
ncbi:hypothetical protein GE21DRAFT_1116261 [Neurospora crassa]|nr:hypothetical protein GE21DRAFT_1116261 [Neurospora crassa]